MFNYRYNKFFKYIFRRFFYTLIILIIVSLFVFMAMIFAPGNPAEIILGQDATPENVLILEKEMGLDLPLPIQYINYLKGLITADFGKSFRTRRPVADEIVRSFPISLELAMIAIAISSVLGILIGVISSVKRGTVFDDVIRISVLAGVSVPIFWLGLVLVYIFSIQFKVFPATGWGTLKHMVLPCLTLATFPLALFVRFTRSSMLEVIRQDYIRTALAKGLPYKTVIYRHALKNALIPVVTLIGLQFAALIGGSVMTETVFNIPGLGRLLISGIYSRDYPIVRTCVVLVAIFFTSINLLVDILYSFIDPRISL